MTLPRTAGHRAVVVAFALAVAGCALVTRRPSPEPSPYRDRAPSLEELRQSLYAREAATRAFRGQARLDYRGDAGSGKASQMVMVMAPDLVRIDVMSPFGPTYTVASDGRQLQAYDRGGKVLYNGAATVQNLQTYTRVSLEARVLALLIRGLPPFLLDRATNERIVRTDGGWGYRADLGNDGSVRLDVDAVRLRPRRVELRDPMSGGVIVVDIDDYDDVDGAELAHRVKATLADGSSVELAYSRIWRDVGLSESAFRIVAPPGVRVIPMGLEAAR